ncbi:Reverse transcriptase [Phytophthora palmivora]|uniref:Reverse transcriptase n=1 Tax=Phytophthora palmivora TaxID=4796 RepID=A0A2P4XLP3_9STRA|nr:Reverse transcriptase [Phytophthora palmivora]
MKRDWNQSADSLASAALRRESGVVNVTEEERQDLVTLIDWTTKDDAATVKIAAVTRSRKKCRPQVLQEEITVAENYEECVFRRFGASEAIRHVREPGFMSDFFRSFNKIVGQRQRATMAYRPQANGTTERMVGTLTRAVKMYVEDIDLRDWDEYAKRLSFALNTAQDRVRGDTPFYLLHGWDPRSTLEAMIPLGSTRRRDREPRRWRYRIQKQYQQAREQVNEKLRDAIQERADQHNETVLPHRIEVGTQIEIVKLAGHVTKE